MDCDAAVREKTRDTFPRKGFYNIHMWEISKGLRKIENVTMLVDQAPRSKLGPSSRGLSFYIENLLGTRDRGASAEERVHKVTAVHSPETTCLSRRRASASDARGSARSEYMCFMSRKVKGSVFTLFYRIENKTPRRCPDSA